MAGTFTAKGMATRARIIAGAAQAVRTDGVTATTLHEICRRTHTSRSQLFHYFPDGKDQLLLEVARHEAGRVLEDQEPYLSNLRTWEDWSAWRTAVLERYRTQGQNCPLSAVTGQLGPASPGAQAVVTQLFAKWQQAITVGVQEMQTSGLVRETLDAHQAAAALLAAIQGGVMILLATGELTHLEAALDVAIDHLRERGPVGRSWPRRSVVDVVLLPPDVEEQPGSGRPDVRPVKPSRGSPCGPRD